MTEKRIREIAAKIAADLFTNGIGERAQRLVLESLRLNDVPPRDLGGWSEVAVIDRVVKILTKELGGGKP